MTTIEGGALVVNDAAEAQAVERLRFHGIARLADGTRDVTVAGGKYNLSDVSARLGLAQLRAWTTGAAPASAWRRTTSSASRTTTCSPRTALPPRVNPGHSWNMFTVLLPLPADGSRAGNSWTPCSAEGIGIGLSYEAIHLTTLFRGRGWREGQFPVSERIGRETVTLPLFADMTNADVERVCASLRRVIRNQARVNAAASTRAFRRHPRVQRGGGAAGALRAPVPGAGRAGLHL